MPRSQAVSKEIRRLDQTIIRLTKEVTQKNAYIQALEKQVCDRDEKLILMLDPVKYSQLKLHNRPRVGAVEMTAEQKKEFEARKKQVQKDVTELVKMGVLSEMPPLS